MAGWPARLSVMLFPSYNVLIFTFIFRCSLVNAADLPLLLESFPRKSDAVAAF